LTRRIGLIIPSSNRRVEAEAPRLLPDGVQAHVARLRMTGPHQTSLDALLPRIAEAAATLADARCEIIAFHCTATAMEGGPEGEAAIRKAVAEETGTPATSTATAISGALDGFGARRIGLVTPYDRAMTAGEVGYLTAGGYEVGVAQALDLGGTDQFCGTEPAFWVETAHRLAGEGHSVDAYVFSCANIRSLEVVDELERTLGVPVVTSNQAIFWDCLRRLGVAEPVTGYGRLLREPAAA